MSFLGVSVLRAADCSHCTVIVNNLALQQDYVKKTKDVIDKNRAYLAALAKDDASKRVKVNSNIFVALLRVEAAQNNIISINQELTQKGCSHCGRQVGNK